MIAYVQEDTAAIWESRVGGWITDLAGKQAGWTKNDLLQLQRKDETRRLAVLNSSHERQNGLENIELCHLWIEMS